METLIYFTVPEFKSTALTVDNEPRRMVYQWSELDVIVENPLRIDFYVDDVLWTAQTVALHAEKKVSPRKSIKRGATVSMWIPLSNGAGEIFLQYYPYAGGGIVTKLFLSADNLRQSIDAARHKITCLVGEEHVDTYTYLGRAQGIVTNFRKGVRVYIWRGEAQSEPFPNVNLLQKKSSAEDHLKDHASDLMRMKIEPKSSKNLHALLSYQHLDDLLEDGGNYEMDNDNFANKYRVLPVTLTEKDTLLIRFYNFKFSPPRSVQVRIPYDDFAKTAARFHVKLCGVDALLTVYHEEAVVIKSIMLTVQDYMKNLDFIQKGPSATK
jgi:hypothetical protein